MIEQHKEAGLYSMSISSLDQDDMAAENGPRYQRIQRVLEERLAAGQYPVGSLMPTEIELASEFATSRFTVREALRHLTERGYIKRKQGLGTRVVATDPKAEYVQSFESLQELFTSPSKPGSPSMRRRGSRSTGNWRSVSAGARAKNGSG